MLRYYAYYSVGGYKDFYLGSNEDKYESTYYLSLLPIWEERAKKNNDTDLMQKVECLRELPQIEYLDEHNTYGLPNEGSVLFSHGSYKLIYRHLQGDTYALAVRDIQCNQKDEAGRSIPFLFVILADKTEDVKLLNKLAAYATEHISAFCEVVSSCFVYDVEKNGLRFELGKFNQWVIYVQNVCSSTLVATTYADIDITSKPNKVSLFLLPNGIPEDLAIKEQKIENMAVQFVKESDLLPKDNPELLIKNLRQYFVEETKRKEEEINKKNLKKLAYAIGGGLVAGYFISKLFS